MGKLNDEILCVCFSKKKKKKKKKRMGNCPTLLKSVLCVV